MSALLEKLKNLGTKLTKGLSFLGENLGSVLTIFSVVVGFLFIRERSKNNALSVDLELKDSENDIKHLKEKVKEDEDKAKQSLADYHERLSHGSDDK